jgi:hypothetical protein
LLCRQVKTACGHLILDSINDIPHNSDGGMWMSHDRKNRSRFPDTRWSLIGQAKASDDLARHKALAELLILYTPALRTFLIKSRRAPTDLVDDLVHDFVAEKILGQKLVDHADQAKGKFRNLLLKALTNFVTTKMKREYATRARATEIDIDTIQEVASQQDIDQFNKEWVQQVVHDALGLMQADCKERNRTDLWEIFCLRIVDPMLHEKEPVTYEEIVRRYEIQTPRQAINLLVTAKRCFSRHLRTAVGRYVHKEEGIDIEITCLREIVGR